MKRSFLLHPGTILSTLVLAGAVAGSVYGATTTGTATVGSAQIKNGSIRLADISPNARKALRGARGLPGVAAAGAAGPAGPAGPPGAPGTARAFGFVSSAGIVDAARSKNITVTKLPATTGEYCVKPAAGSGIDPSKVLPVVTADFQDGTGSFHIAQIDSDGRTGCLTTEGWTVLTANEPGSSFVSTNVAFSILIP